MYVLWIVSPSLVSCFTRKKDLTNFESKLELKSSCLNRLTFGCVFIQWLEGCHVWVPCSCDHIGLPIRALLHRFLRRYKWKAYVLLKISLLHKLKRILGFFTFFFFFKYSLKYTSGSVNTNSWNVTVEIGRQNQFHQLKKQEDTWGKNKRDVPYLANNRWMNVLLTCRTTNYGNVNLALNDKIKRFYDTNHGDSAYHV